MANSNKRQALNVRPYSKYSTVLFIIFHLIAIACHISSFIAGLEYLPKDVLVYPLAELTSTQSEIVGPCLGESTLKNAAGAISKKSLYDTINYFLDSLRNYKELLSPHKNIDMKRFNI